MLDFFHIEIAWSLLAVAVCLGAVVLVIPFRIPQELRDGVRQFQRHPWAPAVCIGLLMVGVQSQVAERYGQPVPAIHDEFSHLLAAKTYAAGRLTNPTPPAWEHLETWHVNMRPTYQSKYPPGHGATLALGQWIAEDPIRGTWLMLGLGAGLSVWMLRGWVSADWAWWGSWIVVFNWPLTKLWGQTYLAGAAAWCGGLLLCGALPRLLRGTDWRHQLGFVVGLCVLSQTRPYEGGILAAIGCLWWWLQPHAQGCSRRHFVGLCVLSLLLILAGTAYYNSVVTGSPWVLPYRLYEATYTRRSTWLQTFFFWTDLGIRPRTIPGLEGESTAAFRQLAETRPELWLLWKIVRNWAFQVGVFWTIPALVALFLRGVRGRSLILAGLIVVGVGILLQRSAAIPHYAAPVYPLMVLWIVHGSRGIRVWGRQCQGRWRLCVQRLPLACLAASSVYFLGGVMSGQLRTNVRLWSQAREQIERRFEAIGGRHLILVRYVPGHSMHEEWIYNAPRPEQSRIVWARELEGVPLSVLTTAYPERIVWQLRVAPGSHSLQEYSPE